MSSQSTSIRVARWQQRKAIAEWLWERGPMTATYQGQMGDQVAIVLNKKLDRKGSFQSTSALSVVRDLIKDGFISREGTEAKPIRFTWVGGDPLLIKWEPDRSPAAPARLSEIQALRDELDELRASFEKFKTAMTLTTQETVREALEEWTGKKP